MGPAATFQLISLEKYNGVTMAVIVRYDDTSDNITYVTHEKWLYQKLYDTLDISLECRTVSPSVGLSAGLSIHLSI